MRNKEYKRHQREGGLLDRSRGPGIERLVSIESQREFDLFTGEWAHRIFVKLYVAARTSGLLAVISDRDWKTLCTLATYMNGEGYCFPSQAELAAAMGCSRQMANERVHSLANFRFQEQPVLVIVKGKRGAAGKWTGNGYQVLTLSSLRIYDTEEERGAAQPTTNDSGTDSRPDAGETVSSVLDTVVDSEPTMSSQTGTVPLDTNKNHSLEQDKSFEDRRAFRTDLSNFEGSHHGTEETGEGQETTRQPTRRAGLVNGAAPIDASSRNGDESSRTGVSSLKELIHRRRQAAGGGPRRGRPTGNSEERERLRAFLADFAIELGDEAPLASTITRTLNIFTAANVPPERWSDLLYQARGLTQEHTAQIRKLATAGGDQIRRKNKMPYFLATLEQLVGLRPKPEPARSPQGSDRSS